MKLPRLYLASESPRRHQILDTLGLAHEVIAPKAEEETPDTENLKAGTERNALLKAQSVLDRITAPGDIAIGADTLVVLGERVMGKPKDRDDARHLLKRLSGHQHMVVTGLALASRERGHRTTSMRSFVTFRGLSEEQIERYLDTPEPYDKAGAYAVQGLASLFIEKIEGSYTNIVGLPIEALLGVLPVFSGIPVHQWFVR